MRRPPRAQLPPRAELPADVRLVALPLWGTTWYERGAAYWARRAGVAAMLLLVIVIDAVMLVAFFREVYHRSGPVALAVTLAVELVIAGATGGVLLYRTARGVLRTPEAPQRMAAARRAGPTKGVGGGTWGMLARMAGPVGGAVVVVAVFLTAGLIVALLVFALLPEWPDERRARADVADALRAHGYRIP